MCRRLLYLFLLLILCVPVQAQRVLVVGDSVTGFSINYPQGYVHEIRKALSMANVTDVQFVPLGGSGQAVYTWKEVVKNSETKQFQLDIKGITVKDEFDKGADIVIIFLGANDILCPVVSDTPEGWNAWKVEYQQLIDMLKARCPFKQLILATPIMISESPYSYKNREIDKMEEVIRVLAKENHATVCETRADFKRVHANARMQENTFRMYNDYVHPLDVGHSVIAVAMLNAIGQKKVADLYLEKHCSEYVKDFQKPGMSLYVVSPTEEGQVVIRGNLRGAKKSDLKVELPKELKLERIEYGTGEEFTIYASGSTPHLSTMVKVSAGEIVREVKLNAPYRVVFGFTAPPFANPQQFNNDAVETQIDKDVMAGKNPLDSQIDGKKLNWLTYYPSADLMGGDDPNCIDFCSMNNGQGCTGAYFFRQVYSPVEQKVKVNFAVNSFSTNEMLRIYLNGQQEYERFFVRGAQKTDSTEMTLKAGWNTIVGRSFHTVWQWVISVQIEGKDLQYR